MAERPIFIPVSEGSILVKEVAVEFNWAPGMAPIQKRRNIASLHAAASIIGIDPVLEISSKSDREIGVKLSAFNLTLNVGESVSTLESVFQGSKVFESGGPFIDLYSADPRIAKRDPRLQSSGRLIGFEFAGYRFPLFPATSFYDWLYISALYPHRDWLRRFDQLAGFSDIEFNPMRSINCQARSCATFVSLQTRALLKEAAQSFDFFHKLSVAAANDI